MAGSCVVAQLRPSVGQQVLCASFLAAQCSVWEIQCGLGYPDGLSRSFLARWDCGWVQLLELILGFACVRERTR